MQQPVRTRHSPISVYARIRPHQHEMPDVALLSEKRLQVRNLEFSLDHAFSEDATQKEVYDIVCRQAASQVLQGLSVCVLAYGQTGSGKTHTMLGSDGVMSGTGSPEHMGICLRAIADLFAAARAASGSSDALGVTCSYVEIYNDQCNDLLGRQAKALSLREGRGGLVVDGLCVQPVASPNEAVEALAAGNAARTVAQMSMNRRSSRSHALFTITVPSTQTSTHGHVQGKLVLVDLAGMETSKTSVGVEKDYPLHGASSKPMRREEARHINTSLCALSSVIERLAALKVSAQYGAQGGLRRPRRPCALPQLEAHPNAQGEPPRHRQRRRARRDAPRRAREPRRVRRHHALRPEGQSHPGRCASARATAVPKPAEA